MRAYMIDEISSAEMDKIKAFIKKIAISSSLEEIFWVKLPDNILSEEQQKHRACQPHAFAMEFGQDWVKLEFLVRSTKNMRCTCPGYGTPSQLKYIIKFAERMIEQLDINT